MVESDPGIGFALILIGLVVAFPIIKQASKGGMTKKAGAVGGWFANLFTSAGGNKLRLGVAIGGYLVILVGISYLWPAFWGWFRGQSFLFWWIILGLPALTAVATKFKFAWWLMIVGVIIAMIAADWQTIPHPLDWRLSKGEATIAAAKRETARLALAPRAAAATTSRVKSKMIIARPDEWSKMIYIPSGHWFRWQAEIDGCMLIKNGRGQIRRVCGNDYIPRGDNLSLLDGMMAFQYPNGEVEVTVEWEPK